MLFRWSGPQLGMLDAILSNIQVWYKQINTWRGNFGWLYMNQKMFISILYSKYTNSLNDIKSCKTDELRSETEEHFKRLHYLFVHFFLITHILAITLARQMRHWSYFRNSKINSKCYISHFIRLDLSKAFEYELS